MLMQHYKEPIIEIFALIALTSAGSATLLFDRTDSTMDTRPEAMEPDLPRLTSGGARQMPGMGAYPESEVVTGPRCKVYTAWCEAEVLLLNINSLKGRGRPSAPSPIP